MTDAIYWLVTEATDEQKTVILTEVAKKAFADQDKLMAAAPLKR